MTETDADFDVGGYDAASVLNEDGDAYGGVAKSGGDSDFGEDDGGDAYCYAAMDTVEGEADASLQGTPERDEKDDLDPYNVQIEDSDSDDNVFVEKARVREELRAASTAQSEPIPPSNGSSKKGDNDERDNSSVWQDRFEAALSLPSQTSLEKLEKALAIRTLTNEFQDESKRLAKTIIEQSMLPKSQKQYQPLSGKGVAGGEKYQVKGIFFKLVRDIHGIYGGDMGASKAAKHEIRSLHELVRCNIEGLFFPMMCLVDHLGIRCVCVSYIKGLGGNTLKYGSCDAGQTVFASDPTMNALCKKACGDFLNLKPHNVIPSRTRRARVIYGPVDLEGHVVETSKGKTHYLLDFGRIFPPIAPNGCPNPGRQVKIVQPDGSVKEMLYTFKGWNQSFMEFLKCKDSSTLRKAKTPEGVLLFSVIADKDVAVNDFASQLLRYVVRGPVALILNEGEIFYRLLRPELVKIYKVPLSSDAFSGFGCCVKCQKRVGACPHDADDAHDALHNATYSIFRRDGLIDTLAAKLNTNEESPSEGSDVVNLMHKNGINLRWMGILRKMVTVDYVKAFLLFEMVARTLRVEANRRLRKALLTNTTAGHHGVMASMVREVVDYLNVVLGESDRSTAMWAKLPRDVILKFQEGIPEVYRDEKIEIRPQILKFPLFVRLKNSLGIEFDQNALQEFFDDPTKFDVETPFSVDHIKALQPTSRAIDTDEEIRTQLFEIASVEAAPPPPSLRSQTSNGSSSFSDGDTEMPRAPPTLLSSLSTIAGIVPLLGGRSKSHYVAPTQQPGSSQSSGKPVVATQNIVEGYARNQTIAERLRKKAELARQQAPNSGAMPSPRAFGLKKWPSGGGSRRASGPVQNEQKLSAVDDNRSQAEGQLPPLESSPSLARSPTDSGVHQEQRTQAEEYHKLALKHLGPKHPYSIDSSFKLALLLVRKLKLDEGLNYALEALGHCTSHYTHQYISGLVCVGEIYLKRALSAEEFVQAIEYFSKALQSTERLFGQKHPLIGKLCCYLGRSYICIGERDRSVGYLHRGYAVYEEFYGSDTANFVVPLMTMGKGEELATALGALAFNIKDMAHEKNSKAENLFSRFTGSIRILEDIEGLVRGYYYGQALTIKHRGRSLSAEQKEAASSEGSGGDKESKSAPEYVESSPGVETRLEMLPAETTAGSLCSFQVFAKSKPVVLIQGTDRADKLEGFVYRSDDVTPQPDDDDRRCYAVEYVPVAAGVKKIAICVGGKPIEGSPFQQIVTSGQAFSKRCAVGGDLFEKKKAQVGVPTTVRLNARDRCGNAVPPSTSHHFDVAVSGAFRMGISDAMSRDYDDDADIITITPPMHGKVQFHASLSASYGGSRTPMPQCEFDFEVVAVDGKRKCNTPITIHSGSTSVELCRMCSMKFSKNCFNCNGMVHGFQKQGARMCRMCGANNTRKCAKCKSFLLHVGGTHPAFVCASCYRMGSMKCAMLV